MIVIIRRDAERAVWGFLLLSALGCAEVEVASLSEQIDSAVNAVVDEGLVAGAAVVVLRGEEGPESAYSVLRSAAALREPDYVG